MLRSHFHTQTPTETHIHTHKHTTAPMHGQTDAQKGVGTWQGVGEAIWGGGGGWWLVPTKNKKLDAHKIRTNTVDKGAPICISLLLTFYITIPITSI